MGIMVDILHRIGIKSSSVDEAYRALTNAKGLADWWTVNTQGVGDRVGGILEFRFGAAGFDMEVTELQSPTTVRWRVIDGPEEWVGTHINWELKKEDDYTIILFKHQGWREPVPFMHHCSTKWAIFLMSLKALLETGQGAPSPSDVKIDNWN